MMSSEMIREMRCRRGETVAEFANFLGLPESIVLGWETGIIAPSYWVGLLVARIVLDAERMQSLNRQKK